MSSTKHVSLADFERLLDSPPRRPRNEPDTRWFPALAWLALAPAWPGQFAAAGFPIDESEQLATGEPVAEALHALQGMGKVSSGPGEPPPEGVWFWHDRQQRTAVIGDILQSPRHGLEYLSRHLSAAAQTMQRAAADRPLNPTLQRWLRLGLAGEPGEMARIIDQEVAAAISIAVQAERLSCPDAARWIETAEHLAELFGGHLEVAVARSRRRLEQFRRDARDKRELRNYYPRPELEQATRDLAADTTDKTWALHYVGDGGNGKTMLIQRIRTALADEQALAIGHIDFDSLNPDYPRRAPGLLLMGFAEDLRLDDDPSIASIFHQFDEAIDASNERLRGVAAPGDGSSPFETTELRLALSHFISALRAIYETHKRRPVLILDTCEELARIRIDGRLPENVAFTFRWLEQIQDAVKPLRVIFSGRRALARRGAGWEWPDCPLPELDYLRLVEVLPFSEPEARGFLERFGDSSAGGGEPRHIPANLYDDILKLCRLHQNDGDPTGYAIRWDDGRPPPASPRYNPYDLDLLARWASSPEGLDVERLTASGIHFYIKERVVDRIQIDVRPFLPHLALLGRFDREMLQQLTGRTGEAFENFWEYVVLLEWTRIDHKPQIEQVWGIDPHYRRRLLSYYRDEEGAVFDNARNQVWELLRSTTLRRSFSELAPAYFVACFAAAPRDGKAAAAWWQAVEDCIVVDANWDWCKHLTDMVLAEDAATALLEAPDASWSLRAAVQATAAAANLHQGATPDASTWEAVAREVERYPDPAGRDQLRWRARFGAMTARLRGAATMDSDMIGEVDRELTVFRKLWARIDAQRLGAGLAMCEAAVELLENTPEAARRAAGLGVEGRNATDMMMRASAPALRAFSLALQGRLAAMRGDRAAAEDQLKQAIEIAGTPGIAGQHWLDWVAPDDPEARLRLELARLVGPTGTVAPNVANIDQERLRAATFLWELRDGIPAVGEADLIAIAFTPCCNAHRAFPPLFAVAIEARAAAGEFESAQRAALAISLDRSQSMDLRMAADRALLGFAIPMLLAEEKIGLETTLSDSTSPGDRALAKIMVAQTTGDWAFPAGEATALTGLVSLNPGYPPGRRGLGVRTFLGRLLLMLSSQGDQNEFARAARLSTAPGDGFEVARKDFEMTGDQLGVLLCTLAAAMERPRGIGPGRFREAVEQALANPICPSVAGSRPTPRATGQEWTDFVDAVPLAWKPWMTRLAAYAIWAREYWPTGDATRHFRGWLDARYRGVIPADISRLFAPSAFRKMFSGKWVESALTILALGISASILYLGYLLYGLVYDASAEYAQVSSPTWVKVLGFFVLLGFLGGLPSLV